MTRATHRGFTLLELLVAMTLLSIIMVGLVSALRGMAQTETRIDARLQRLDEMRVARAFLQQALSRVSASLVDAPGATGKMLVPFTATPNSLTWVGILPARPDVGGRHVFRLAVEGEAEGRELVLRFLPWDPNAATLDWASAQSRVLGKGVAQLGVESQGLSPEGRNPAEAWPKGWGPGWPIPDALPEQLRLEVSGPQGTWPQLTLALHPLPQGDASMGGVVVGGSRR